MKNHVPSLGLSKQTANQYAESARDKHETDNWISNRHTGEFFYGER